MGKTKDLFKIFIDTKGTLHAKMGSIKDRDSKDLTETEEIKKRLQEYTENLSIKGLNNPDNHDSVVIHLEPDILECEVKWALGSITPNKASGDDGIQAELFQILKDDALKVLYSTPSVNTAPFSVTVISLKAGSNVSVITASSVATTAVFPVF